jgi:hypothetical protein
MRVTFLVTPRKFPIKNQWKPHAIKHSLASQPNSQYLIWRFIWSFRMWSSKKTSHTAWITSQITSYKNVVKYIAFPSIHFSIGRVH